MMNYVVSKNPSDLDLYKFGLRSDFHTGCLFAFKPFFFVPVERNVPENGVPFDYDKESWLTSQEPKLKFEEVRGIVFYKWLTETKFRHPVFINKNTDKPYIGNIRYESGFQCYLDPKVDSLVTHHIVLQVLLRNITAIGIERFTKRKLIIAKQMLIIPPSKQKYIKRLPDLFV